MSSLVLTGSTSGTVSVQAPAVAGSNTATIGAATGTHYPFTSGTAVASTSGTSIDFTSIPSWVKRITVSLNAVSTNGTSVLQVQLGTSSGVTTSGYIGTSDTQGATSGTPTALTSGLGLGRVTAANYSRYGQVVFTLIGSNTWSGNYVGSTAVVLTIEQGSCAVTLASDLDRVRITTVNGTDTFDAGSINIMYE